MILLALLTLACVPPTQASDQLPVMTGGQAALSVDHWRGAASLQVQTFVPGLELLPEERQGIPMGGCARLRPNSVGDSLIFQTVLVQARCEGYTLLAGSATAGMHRWEIRPMPAPGTVCTVAVDGVTIDLPPLPAWSEPELRGRHLSWTPGGADEVRVVTIGSDSESTICRLPDTGSGKLKRGMGRGTTFVTWHSARFEQVGERPMSLSATVGTWLD